MVTLLHIDMYKTYWWEIRSQIFACFIFLHFRL